MKCKEKYFPLSGGREEIQLHKALRTTTCEEGKKRLVSPPYGTRGEWCLFSRLLFLFPAYIFCSYSDLLLSSRHYSVPSVHPPGKRGPLDALNSLGKGPKLFFESATEVDTRLAKCEGAS